MATFNKTDAKNSSHSAANEWREVRDANDRLLCFVSLVSGHVRIKARELTTEFDPATIRSDAVREVLGAH